MADYHHVYKDVEGASTQWDDIQRKLGNLPPKPPPFKPLALAPAEDEDLKPKGKTWIDQKTEDELEDLDDDLDDDRFLQEYRKKRLSEMRELSKIVRFGFEVSQAPPEKLGTFCRHHVILRRVRLNSFLIECSKQSCKYKDAGRSTVNINKNTGNTLIGWCSNVIYLSLVLRTPSRILVACCTFEYSGFFLLSKSKEETLTNVSSCSSISCSF